MKKMIEYFYNLWYHRIKDRGVVKMEKLTVFDVADFFRKKETMTHKKLQKLVYYAYAWYVALNNEDPNDINQTLFNDHFEAWVHGPVCPNLYHRYSNNYGQVEKYNGKLNELISGELEKFLGNIYKVFGKYSGDELESMTHQEMPWQNARDNLAPYEPSNKRIAESDMFVYYNKL